MSLNSYMSLNIPKGSSMSLNSYMSLNISNSTSNPLPFKITKALIKESLEELFSIECEGFFESLEQDLFSLNTLTNASSHPSTPTTFNFHPNVLIDQEAILSIHNPYENNTLNFKSDMKGTTIVWTNLTVENDLVVNGNIVTEGAGLTLISDNEGIKNLTVKNNFTVNGKAQLSNETVNVSKTWYVASKTATKSVVTGTTVTVGDATSKAGGLFDIQGVIDLGNNTDILVYGDINAGKDAVATILEATGSDSNMPASVTYSGKNTYSNILTNWPKGGPSQMME